MRERAFAVLGDRVRGSRFLDLWAGTGAVGLEALSRGARSVVFVERHRAAARLIEENSAAAERPPELELLYAEGKRLGGDAAAAADLLVDTLTRDPTFDTGYRALAITCAQLERPEELIHNDLCDVEQTPWHEGRGAFRRRRTL